MHLNLLLQPEYRNAVWFIFNCKFVYHIKYCAIVVKHRSQPIQKAFYSGKRPEKKFQNN